MTDLDSDAIIAVLDLAPHPEGGWYRETFRDSPSDGGRGVLTQMLSSAQRRALPVAPDRRIEVSHFYTGEPLPCTSQKVTAPFARSCSAALSRTAGGARGGAGRRLAGGGTLGVFALVSCTVAPAFQFAGFELAPEGWAP